MRDYGEWGDLDWRIAGDPPSEFVEAVRRHVDGTQVVEFGAGSGRMMLPLLRAGFDVVGVDSSPTMLGILTSKCSDFVVRLRCMDVASGALLPLEADGVLMGYNLVSMFQDAQARRRAFRCARECLRPDGVLLVQNFRPILIDQQLGSGDDTVVPVLLDGEQWLIRYQVDRATSSLTVTYVQETGAQAVLRRVSARILTDQDLERELTEAGFNITAVSSTWDGAPVETDSQDLIIACRKSAEAV